MLPVTDHKVDIGVEYSGIPRKRQERAAALSKNSRNPDMEKKARLQECKCIQLSVEMKVSETVTFLQHPSYTCSGHF